jgi:hypothetical protein
VGIVANIATGTGEQYIHCGDEQYSYTGSVNLLHQLLDKVAWLYQQGIYATAELLHRPASHIK